MSRNCVNIGLKFNSKFNLHDGGRVFAVFTILLLVFALLPVFVLPVSADVDDETQEFKFMVKTDVANQVFSIPVSSCLGGGIDVVKLYSWNIVWGDGDSEVKSDDSSDGGGISHTHSEAGEYTITITPAGSDDAWFAAFGFYSNTVGANAQTNKDMVTCVLSPLTPLMTRTTVELTLGAHPNDEWAYAFFDCRNLVMGSGFTFSAGWDEIESVGHCFAGWMFFYCNGDGFSMGEGFNLPQNLESVGDLFANSIFWGCGGDGFSMNERFNLPQGITSVGNYFAYGMFMDCSGAGFVVNDKLLFPI